MKTRNPVAVLLLPIITLGIYAWVWLVKTKNELNRNGASIPTAWIWLIPVVGGLYWYWKYAEGVEIVTKGKVSGILAFVLLLVLGVIGMAVLQNTYNQVGAAQPAPAPAPAL